MVLGLWTGDQGSQQSTHYPVWKTSEKDPDGKGFVSGRLSQ